MAVEFEAEMMVEGLRQIRESLRATDEKIQEICFQFPQYEYLMSIPDFRPDVSFKVWGGIGDPGRFQNGRQLLKTTGLDLNAERSGKTSDMATPVIVRSLFTEEILDHGEVG